MQKDYGLRIIMLCLLGNVFLLLLKGAVGLWVGSEALKADAVNSAGDVLSGAVMLVGLKYSLKPGDSDHHYGHGKMEALVSLIVGIMIISGMCFVVYEAVGNALSQIVKAPSWYAFGAAAVSVFIKLFMFKATYAAGKRLNSIAVITSAKDHRNDIWATTGAAAAIAAAFAGTHFDINALAVYSEPAVAVLIGALIVKTAIGIIAESSRMLLDAAPDDKTMQALRSNAEGAPGVRKICWLKCRRMGRGLLVDVAVGVCGSISVLEGHDVADAVSDAIKADFPQVIDVIVHVNPEI
ncbi:MAG: cation diffusion facilitator family transporter [Christensenellales bacterium]